MGPCYEAGMILIYVLFWLATLTPSVLSGM